MSAHRRSSDANSGDKKKPGKEEGRHTTEKKPSAKMNTKREVERIIGVTDDNGELEIGIKFKGKESMELIPARIANLEFPQQIIAYYEERLVWESREGATTKAALPNKKNRSA